MPASTGATPTSGGAGGVQSAAEAQRRRVASKAAAVVAVLGLMGAVFLLIDQGDFNDTEPSTKNTMTKEVTTGGGQPRLTKTVTVTETVTPAADRSLVGRAFDRAATPLLFQLFLAALFAFAAGALVQRVVLGEYGITVGPVSLPSLPMIEAKEAEEAVDRITESPKIGALLGPGPRGPQPLPRFMNIEDDRLALISIRVELEEALRELAQAAGIDRDVALARLPSRLVTADVIDADGAKGLRDFLAIGDKIAAGADFTVEAASEIRDRAHNVLYAVRELRSRLERDAGDA